jgi:hypothetical protein
MLVNGLAMLAAHYCLPQPAATGGWLPPDRRYQQRKQENQRINRRRKRILQAIFSQPKAYLATRTSRTREQFSPFLLLHFSHKKVFSTKNNQQQQRPMILVTTVDGQQRRASAGGNVTVMLANFWSLFLPRNAA